MREASRMSIQWKVLGQPGADNALFLTVDTGQAVDHLLFDCGEGCLNSLKPAQIQSISHLGFSHFHMDHVCGFDTFFRHNYNRPDLPVHVWGPPGTIEILSHRFRSFSWNLHEGQPGEWIVRESDGTSLESARFLTHEAFAQGHTLPSVPLQSATWLSTPRFSMEARLLPHHNISSVAYRIIEAERRNISPEALQHSRHAPGPWLQALTDDSRADEERIEMGESERTLGELRAEFVRTTPGSTLAYLTDFRAEPGTPEWDSICQWLEGTGVLVCECQYRQEENSLAAQNGHMTAAAVGQLARDAGVKELVLQHLSRRYSAEEWGSMLAEARESFPAADFPPEWRDSIPQS
ncbi:MAG: MBL fold metallo-hydrolase [Verrucomicrobiota bacterium]